MMEAAGRPSISSFTIYSGRIIMAYMLGIDVSTTATKALLIDDRGDVVDVAAVEYSFQTPHPLWSEQAPDLWWQGAIQGIRQLLARTGVDPAQIAGIGLTGQMHGLVLLDGQGHVLRPAILWNDQRTAVECEAIHARVGRERLIRITGNEALTGFTAPKILWVANHEPDLYARAEHVLLPKDYVRYRLTGAFGTDKAGAAGTLLMDLKARDWSPEILEALDIPAAWLPSTHEGPEITGRISEEAAALTEDVVGMTFIATSVLIQPK
jgi:xylulokinase